MGSIHWLASYPKSGNTWMRILLANYFSGADEPVDFNRLDVGPIASARRVFDDNIGIETSDLTPDEIDSFRPAVYDHISNEILANSPCPPTSPVVFKVHDAFTRTLDGSPIFSKNATAGVIYVIRNPLDIVPSFADHSGASLDQIVARLADPEAAFASSSTAMSNQLRQKLLTWSDHVRSWIDEPDLRHIVVRYEDLVADAAAAISGVIAFLGFEPDPVRVDMAVDFSSFERLRERERVEAFRERSPVSNAFFRKGTVGDGAATLRQDQVEQVCADHHAVMTRFGYLET